VDASPVIKVRIIPSKSTKTRIRNRDHKIEEEKRKTAEQLARRRRASQGQAFQTELSPAPQPNELESRSEIEFKPSIASSVQSSHTHNNPTDLFSSNENSSILHSEIVLEDENSNSIRDGHQYELEFTGQTNWMSQNIKLIKGDYLVFVAMEYGLSYTEIQRRSLPRDLGEAPWIDPLLANYLLHGGGRGSDQQVIPLEFNPMKFFLKDKLSEHDDDNRSLTSLKDLEKRLFEQKAVVQTVDTSVSDNHIKQLLEHRINMEASTTDRLELTPVNEKNKGCLQMFDYSLPLFSDFIRKETWPITCESQSEVSSTMLYNSLTALREEAETLAEEFIGIVKKLKEIKKSKFPLVLR
jgi:hypothetical protein